MPTVVTKFCFGRIVLRTVWAFYGEGRPAVNAKTGIGWILGPAVWAYHRMEASLEDKKLENDCCEASILNKKDR
jgi:hypothetical protein